MNFVKNRCRLFFAYFLVLPYINIPTIKSIDTTTIATINLAKSPTVDQLINPNAARKTIIINTVIRQPPKPPPDSFDILFHLNFK